MTVVLHTYQCPFSEKLRPGFVVGEVLFVLTHARQKVEHSPVSASQITSTHYKDERVTYLIRSPIKTERFNNVPGGFLQLGEDNLVFIHNHTNTTCPTVNSPSLTEKSSQPY